MPTAVWAASAVPLGWAFGCPLMGWAADRIGLRKPVLIAGMLLMAAAVVQLPFLPDLMPAALDAVHFRSRIRCCDDPLSIIKEANPDKVKGSATGAINFIVFGVTALIGPVFASLFAKTLTGRRSGHPLSARRIVLARRGHCGLRDEPSAARDRIGTQVRGRENIAQLRSDIMTGTAAHFIASILDKAGVKRIYGVAGQLAKWDPHGRASSASPPLNGSTCGMRKPPRSPLVRKPKSPEGSPSAREAAGRAICI